MLKQRIISGLILAFILTTLIFSIGDLYLAGAPIQGYFLGNKSGHYLNNLLLRSLFSKSFL